MKIQQPKRIAGLVVCLAGLALGWAEVPSQAIIRIGTADEGGALFEAKCAGCHGKDGRGSTFGKQNGAPDFTDAKWQEQHNAVELKNAVTNGKGAKMPAWKGKLSPIEIEAVVAHVRAFGAKH